MRSNQYNFVAALHIFFYHFYVFKYLFLCFEQITNILKINSQQTYLKYPIFKRFYCYVLLAPLQ